MKVYLLVSLLILVSACVNPNGKDTSLNKSTNQVHKRDFPLIQKKIDEHFNKHRIEPNIIVNNVDNQNSLVLGSHEIKFVEKEAETIIRIDDDAFTLKNQLTLNDVHDSDKSDVDFANTWNQARLYKLHGEGQREIILLNLEYSPCTGLGCSVEYTLIYDITNKTKNFFGSFRGSDASELYSYNGNMYYASNNFRGSYHGDTQVEYSKFLYKMYNNGQFNLCLSDNNRPYYIKTVLHPENPKLEDSFEEKWIETIIK